MPRAWQLGLAFTLVACAELRRASPDEPSVEPPAEAVEPTSPAPATKPSASHPRRPTAPKPIADAGVIDASDPPTRASHVPALCEAYCKAGARCIEDTGGSAWTLGCLNGCYRTWDGHTARMRDDYVAYATLCFDALACDEDKNTCLTNWNAFEAEPSEVPVVKACLAKREQPCKLVQEFECYQLLAYDDETRSALEPCFSGSCVDVQSCIETARSD